MSLPHHCLLMDVHEPHVHASLTHPSASLGGHNAIVARKVVDAEILITENFKE